MLDDLKKALKAELRLQVTVWDPDDESAEHAFSSFVMEAAGSMMRIAPPAENADKIIPLMKKGFVVGVVMETYPSPYIFYPIIHIDPVKPAEGIWLMIPNNTEIEVFQRRRHVRIPMEVPIDLEFANGAMTVSMPARTIDVSGGGLMFNSQRCFPKDEELTIYLQFDLEQPRMVLPSKVVLSRENRTPKREDDRFSTAVQFVGLDAAKEMLLVRECFRCELRRKQQHR
jgi:c-di-GMP-binding flagellar brake protein YcgR